MNPEKFQGKYNRTELSRDLADKLGGMALDAAKDYLRNWHDVPYDLEGVSLGQTDGFKPFNNSLLRLVFTSDAFARTLPAYEESEELRWVPVAKQMLRRGARELSLDRGYEKFNLFRGENADVLADLYREMVDNRSNPFRAAPDSQQYPHLVSLRLITLKKNPVEQG